MHLTIRDLLSITAIVALGIALVRESRLHNVKVQALEKQIRTAENNRIVAISSAGSDVINMTDRIISKVEKQTGYDATRFRKLMTPIEALRPTQQ